MSKRPLCVIFLGLIIGICMIQVLGFSWIWKSPAGPVPDPQEYPDELIKASGIVYQQEEKTYQNKTYTYIYIKQTTLTIHTKEYPVRHIKCIIEGTEEWLLEENISVTGYLSTPEEPTNPGEFNKKQWEQAQKIDYYIEECHIQKVEKRNKGILSYLTELRKIWMERIHEIFPEKESGILDAMLFGTKDFLGEDIKYDFQAAGISHIMAISGLHISLIGMAVWSGLQWIGFPIGISVGLSFPILFGYLILIGNPATAFRACFMFALMAMAKVLGRAYDKLSALSAAGMLLLLDNPDLLFSSGFQLSFLAVIGMSEFGENIEKIYEIMWKGKNKKIWKDIRMGISLWIFSLPIVLFHFYQVSVVGILCNLVVIPLLPIVAGTAFGALFLGTWNIRLGSIVGSLAYGILKLYQWMGDVAQHLSVGVWTPGQPSIVEMILYYAIILGIWAVSRWLAAQEEFVKKYRLHVIVGHIFCLGILILLIARSWNNPKQITVLDVGQGDGIVIQENGYTAMLDGGSSSRSNVGKYVIVPYLKQQGIATVHLVMVTHSDEDHVNGIEEVLEEAKKGWLSVKILCMPGWMKNTENGKALLEAAKEIQCTVIYVETGDQIRMGDGIFEVLYPTDEDFSQSPNEGSLVVAYRTPEASGLFMGDLPMEQEQYLLQEVSDCEYIKIGHHGSNGSTSNALLERADPEVALISCGKNNRYGHPGKELLERLEGICILRTDQQGALTIREKDLAQIK